MALVCACDPPPSGAEDVRERSLVGPAEIEDLPDDQQLAGQVGEGTVDLFEDPSYEDAKLVDVIYESSRVLDEDGKVAEFQESGFLSAEDRAALRQPWLYLEHGLVYDDEVWSEVKDGTTTEYYRAFRRAITPIVKEVEHKPAYLELALEQRISQVPENASLVLLVRVRRGEDWPDLVATPHAGYASASDFEVAKDARRHGLARREEITQQKAVSIESYINEHGGYIEGRMGSIGWITAQLPAMHILGLLELQNVEKVMLEKRRKTTASRSATFRTNSTWTSTATTDSTTVVRTVLHPRFYLESPRPRAWRMKSATSTSTLVALRKNA